MKEKDITSLDEEQLETWSFGDVNNTDDILQAFDEQLKQHGLNLLVGDYGDDNVWIKIIRKRR